MTAETAQFSPEDGGTAAGQGPQLWGMGLGWEVLWLLGQSQGWQRTSWALVPQGWSPKGRETETSHHYLEQLSLSQYGQRNFPPPVPNNSL